MYINSIQSTCTVAEAVRFTITLLIFLFNWHFIFAKPYFEADDLKFVAILHRHGDRSPGLPYANDPYKDRPWPGGYGALSRKGALQLYDLGKHLRSRYARLLPSDGFYTQENMRVLSSFAERCLMSSASLLAGLMPPPETCQGCLPNPWQPVPVNAIPANQDYTLYQFGVECPRYDALYNKLVGDPDPDTDIYKYNQKIRPLYEYLRKHSGENVTNVGQVFFIHDVLFVEDSHDLPLPPWTTTIYPAVLLSVRARAFQLFTETQFMKRIRGGPLLTDIYQQMLQKQINALTRNFAIYSAHDSTVVNLMRALNVTEQTTNTPDYGAAVALELHCPVNQECHVKILYNFNTHDRMPKQLNIPDCPHPCSLSQFGIVYNDMFVSNITQECIG